MPNARNQRILIMAGVAALIVAAAIVPIVSRGPRAPDEYFMPGPLGRQPAAPPSPPRPLDRSPDRRNFSISAFQPFSISPRPFLTRVIGLRAGEETEWGRRNGLTAGIPFSHNLANVFPRSLYATHPDFFPLAEGKRLNPTPGYINWNPDLGREDVARFAAHAAASYFTAHPEAVSFALGVNDGLVFGESPETLRLVTPPRWFRSRPDYSALVFTFMNRAAAELARTFPDKYLGCLAYYWAENAPPFGVDPHVIPFLTADRTQSYDPAFKREEFALQRRWAAALGIAAARGGKTEMLTTETLKSPTPTSEDGNQRPGAHHASDLSLSASQPFSISAFQNSVSAFQNSLSASQPFSISAFQNSVSAFQNSLSAFQRFSISKQPFSMSADPALQRRIGLYDYLDGLGFLIPRVPIHALAEHIQHAHSVGFTDYYGESSRNWGLDGPMPWVIAQLLQDPDRDVDALLDHYYRAYFQSAAEPMRAFFTRCEQQWMQQGGRAAWLKDYRNEAQARLFPSSVCAELRQLLDAAAAAAAIAGRSVDPSTRPSALPIDRSTDRRIDRPAQRAPFDPAIARSAVSNVSISAFQRFSVSASDIVRSRVAFVSDSFGVTERFVAFCEARDELARQTLHHTVTAAALEAYLARRSDFIRYTHQITERWPLAFYPIAYDDWLKNDPAFAAAYELAAKTPVDPSTRRSVDQPPVPPPTGPTAQPINRSTDPQLDRSTDHPLDRSTDRPLDRSTDPQLDRSTDRPLDRSTDHPLDRPTVPQHELPLASARNFSISESQNFRISGFQRFSFSPSPLPNPSLEGPLIPGRRIAGLQFGLDLPAPWRSRVEPTETHRGVIWPAAARTGRQGLRINGAEFTEVYQWLPAKAGVTYAASVATRGHVSASAAVVLTLAWLDAKQRPVGRVQVMRLPTGAWPGWVELRQGGRAPDRAAWVGIGIRLQRQAPGDWSEFDDFTLHESTAAEIVETLKH